MDDDRLRTQEMQKFREKAISLVNEFKGKEPWGWKDPRNTLLIKFWREVIPGLKVVLSVRNPLDVAVSLNKRNNLSFAFSINLWLTYNKSIIERIPERDLLVTHYDNYFVNPERELERVTDFLNLRTSRELIKEACSTISKGLRHSISTIEDLRKIPYADEAIEIYQYLCNLADFNYECIANRSVSYPSKRYIEDTSSQNTMEKSQHIDERLIEVDRLNAIYRELRRTEILFVHEINGYLKAQQEEKEALLREVQARDLYIDKLKALLKESSEKLETASVASKRAEEIVKAFEKTIMDLKRDTLSASTSMAIGELCFNSGKYHEAKTFFYRALKEPELQPDAFNNLAVVSFNEGNPLSAKYYLLESLRIAPENKEAKMNLAQIERLSYDEDQFHEYLRAIPEKIQLHMHEKALFLDPWCHDFSVLGIKTPQRQNCSELNQNGQDEIFRLIKEAIRLCRETSDRAKGVELFSADAFYANYAVMAGADEMECVDIDDYEIAKAELITKILGNTERMIFNRGDVFKLSDSYDFCICAGGLYHLENPLELLELLSEKTRTALIIQTVYSLAHEADDYFETPPPGRKWGCRFSYGYLTKMLERSGWIVVSEKRDISVGNEKQADSGFAYLLCISGSVLERYGSVQLEALLKDRVVPYGLDRK
jgi:tetratricopeptide (TPR) repeat protein